MNNYIGKPVRSFLLTLGATAVANDGVGSDIPLFNTSTMVVRVWSTVDAYISFGSPANGVSLTIPANQPEYFVAAGVGYISALPVSGITGTVSVSEMSL